jgi:hypothetical protein
MRKQSSRTYPARSGTDARPTQTIAGHDGPAAMTESELDQVAAAGSKPGMVGDGCSPPAHRTN